MSKIYPGVIGSSYKMFDDFLVIPNYIETPHPDLVETSKKYSSSLQTSWHPGYDGKFSFVVTF